MKKIKYIIGIILIIAIDLISKTLIQNKLHLNESIIIIKNFFKITYTKNDGAAFGILDGKIMFLIIISLLILIYLLYELIKKNQNTLINTGITFIIGGLIGNLFDRIYYGYVRDFLDFTIFNYDFAIFNLGDTFIVLGVITYLLGIIKEEQNENKNKQR